MGIERFFKSINSLYSNEIIKPLYKNNNITQFYFDFNSIIHKISNTVTEHINDLLLYSLINKYANESGMNQDLLLDEFNLINKIYKFKYSIAEFYKHIKEINLNKIIFNTIFEDIHNYLSFYPNCKLLYIGIDGVPSVGKMVEQQDRRYKGYLMSQINKKLIEKYKDDLNNSNFSFTNIYNELEYINLKLSFDKNLISPQTDFMVNFITQLKMQDFKVKTIVSDFNEEGEGEKKIVKYIKQFSNKDDRIIIYSPDADMIIMAMILPYYIYILRHEQSESRDDIIDIQSIRKIFTPVEDIAYIFSVFGDDFIPKIEWINVVKHLPKILEEYKKMNVRIINNNQVNFKNLQLFFKNIKKFEYQFVPTKNRFTDFYGTVNHKSFSFYNEKNDIEKLSRKYEPTFNQEEKEIPALDYYLAMKWKYNYYFLDDESNNNYYYKYDNAPTIDQLIEFKNFDKIQLNYKTMHIMPIDQLCFISPINVSEYVKQQKLNNQLADKLYKLMKIKLPEIELKGNDKIINIEDIFECKNARYLNKCDLKFKIINFNEFKGLLG
jgi:5'-3' exonuclease